MYQYTKATRILGTIVLRNEAFIAIAYLKETGRTAIVAKKSDMEVYGETARPWPRSGSRRKQPIGARRL